MVTAFPEGAAVVGRLIDQRNFQQW
jgi:hypothetical protein